MNYLKHLIIIFFIGLLGSIIVLDLPAETRADTKSFGMVIHGGAGSIKKGRLTPKQEEERRAKLNEALVAGYDILKKGGSSLDAIEAAIRILEDSPMFNAGKGAVFTGEGTNELDASIMDGKTLNAGAVAGVKHIKNPISLARKVMEKSPHVMLSREGAEAYAQILGIEKVPNSYFYTKPRWKNLQKAKEKEKKTTQKKKNASLNSEAFSDPLSPDHKFGTVGAVALDQAGNLAGGTSTGGMTNKKYGRIGDSPVIGAGTYANNQTCAVSCTGHGEYFIRSVVAYDISALMEYKGLSLKDAAHHVVMEKLKERGGSGGIIAIDHKGNIAMPFNTPGMYRGHIDAQGKVTILFYK